MLLLLGQQLIGSIGPKLHAKERGHDAQSLLCLLRCVLVERCSQHGGRALSEGAARHGLFPLILGLVSGPRVCSIAAASIYWNHLSGL